MKESVRIQANAMRKINDLIMQGEIVIFGSTYMSNFPLYELVNKCTFENAIYNRSIEGLTINEALEIVDDCVVDLHPNKLFLALGEEDKNNPNAIEDYITLVSTLHSQLPKCNLYLIGLTGIGSFVETFNKNIKSLCNEKSIIYINFITKYVSESTLYKVRFKQLSSFFRNKPLNMHDAFEMGRL